MKLITRCIIALVFLIAFATPLVAQVPNIAIRVQPSGSCVNITFKNLTASLVNFTRADLVIFEQDTCRRVCSSRVKFDQELLDCHSTEFRICCGKLRLPSKRGYIYYVRVYHNLGMNEEWAFAP